MKAVQLLEEKGSVSSLLDYLAKPDTKSIISKPSHRKKKSIDAQRSQAVIDLEHKDPEKYQILLEFDSLLRKKEVLPKLSDIRKLGQQLSKDFPNVRSRTSTISKLMSILAERTIEEIQQIIEPILSSLNLQESEYQQLASFIITGKAVNSKK